MQKVITKSIVNLPPGTVMRLSREQAARRIHLLKRMRGSNLYYPTESVQFKVGEQFELERIDKAMEGFFEVVEKQTQNAE